MGIESYIANVSMQMAQQSVQTSAGVSIAKKVMDSTEQNAMQLIESIAEVPAAYGEVGGLMNITA